MGYFAFSLFRYKAVWLIFFVLGLGTLLPWNFFMTATQVRLGTGEALGPRGCASQAFKACFCASGHRAKQRFQRSTFENPTVFHTPSGPAPEYVHSH